MNMNKETSSFADYSFTEKVRISNVFIFVLLQLVRNFEMLFALTYIFTYLHIFISILFIVSELGYVIIHKKVNHIFTNWILLLGLIILFANLIMLYQAKN